MAPVVAPAARTRRLWVGTYPADGAGTPAGRGEGIWSVGLTDTGRWTEPALAVVTPAPSFLAVHPSGRVLYAVGEQADGTVSAFAVPDGRFEPPVGSGTSGRPDALVLLDVVASGGADPCHLLLAPDARTLYVANYSSGTVAVLPLEPDGRFTAQVRATGAPVQVLAHTGTGPDATRQEGPHAHFVTHAPGGRHVVVADLGTDELRRYERDAATGLLTAAGIAATLPPGTGPRHLVFSSDGRFAYVVGELDVTVRVLAWDVMTASGTLVQTVSASPWRVAAAVAVASSERMLPSHVVLDGDRLLVGVRAAGFLAVHTVGADGLLARAPDVHLPGRWPRHFAVVDGQLVVAEQVDGHLAALRRDGAVESTCRLVSPACVVVA